MITQIDFSRIVTFTGRNGTFKCKGIEIMEISDNRIMLSPVTSLGSIGRCNIDIPFENLQEFVDSLYMFQTQRGGGN